MTATIAATEPQTQTPGMAAPLVSFVIPAYNEEDRLPAGLDRVVAFLSSQDFDSEIVIADDGSRDRTPEIAQERMRRLADLPSSARTTQASRTPSLGA